MSAAITLTGLREGDVDIQFLVERLEALVVNGRKVPMTSQVILEQAAVLDLIDQLRVAIPEEVKQARRINQESDRVLSKAREEAEQIIGAAQEQAALLLQDQSILREAETRSQDVLDKAQAKAEETMHGADQYAADVLVRLESDLVKTLSVIEKTLEVKEARRASMPTSSRPIPIPVRISRARRGRRSPSTAAAACGRSKRPSSRISPSSTTRRSTW